MKILVCVDGSAQSMKAVVKSSEIAAGCQVHVVALVGVYEAFPFPIISEESTEHTITHEMEKYELMKKEGLKNLEKYLEHAAMRFREKGINPEIIIKEGHPAETISHIAKEGDFDMIILGNRGQGNLKSLLLGSVSNAVIQQTQASVLVVK